MPAPADNDDVGVVPGQPSGAGPDSPRQLHGQKVFFGTALIGSPRNDEYILISHLHLTMLQFHNKGHRDGRLGGGVPVRPFHDPDHSTQPAARPAARAARRHHGRPGHGHRAAHPGRPDFRPVAPPARDDGSFDMALISFAEQP
jgi:hypothetical protein